MIPKKMKYTITLAILTLSTVCLMSGCKKKHDRIDLAGSEPAISESQVQTAPAVTQTEESANSEISIEPGIENAAGQPQGTTAGGSASTLSLSVRLDTYRNGNISIQYPVITDASVKASVNDHIKDNALSLLSAYGLDEANDTLDVTCKVLSATKSRITIRYEGSFQVNGGAHPSAVFYTNTVNTGTGADIGLSQIADPSTLASYVLSGDCTFPEADAETIEAAKTFLAENDHAYYLNLFQNADFPYSGNFPECFSYEFEGSVYFSLPVAHAIGDYILAVYTPENK